MVVAAGPARCASPGPLRAPTADSKRLQTNCRTLALRDPEASAFAHRLQFYPGRAGYPCLRHDREVNLHRIPVPAPQAR